MLNLEGYSYDEKRLTDIISSLTPVETNTLTTYVNVPFRRSLMNTSIKPVFGKIERVYKTNLFHDNR